MAEFTIPQRRAFKRLLEGPVSVINPPKPILPLTLWCLYHRPGQPYLRFDIDIRPNGSHDATMSLKEEGIKVAKRVTAHFEDPYDTEHLS